ncbi:MAG: galactokinase [Algoriphagus sp.]|uniref:galactokinase n=1 Tax=Algoriphagus sp. TaxID=1872435 RepID=UPI00273017E7|nr:galactokinase [Algoriphagus sp.]MDP2041205.1 galactokinase [Algoriphagus sp.]MDP3472140.1 galactokinase [Algoriphagus sp.]
MRQTLTQAFLSHFSITPILAFAPGRINLIGEHTDYQEGFVFPAAVNQGIWVGIQKNELNACRIYSIDFNQEFTFELDFISPKKGHWATYAMGMCALLKQAGYSVTGFDMVIGGDIPVGSGLSSSAALSVAIGTAISGLFDFQIPKKNIALYAQKSEHLYAGVNCGIMDPYASAFGVKDKALLLDCRSNTHEEIPVALGDFSLILINSKVKHSLADSAYNKRRASCEESVKIVQSAFPDIKTLRDLSVSDLPKVERLLSPALFPKAKHVITECHRVHEAANALKSGDLENFGNLLKASHQSLSSDFEVSCPELDFLAEESWKLKGVLGSRMMGGGFGGCTINLVQKSETESFQDQIKSSYVKQFGISPGFIPVKIGSGAQLV